MLCNPLQTCICGVVILCLFMEPEKLHRTTICILAIFNKYTGFKHQADSFNCVNQKYCWIYRNSIYNCCSAFASILMLQFPEVISLNVGGMHFTTRLSTLRRYEDTMLAAMFSGRHYIPRDADGRYFIDRDGTYFGWAALCYLHDDSAGYLLLIQWEQQFLFSIGWW